MPQHSFAVLVWAPGGGGHEGDAPTQFAWYDYTTPAVLVWAPGGGGAITSAPVTITPPQQRVCAPGGCHHICACNDYPTPQRVCAPGGGVPSHLRL